MPKIISECYELVKLCHINRSGPFFLRHSVYIVYKTWSAIDAYSCLASSSVNCLSVCSNISIPIIFSYKCPTMTSVIKVKVKWIYIAPSRKTSKALRYGSHSFTCNYTNACLYIVSIHQMAPPQTEVANI